MYSFQYRRNRDESTGDPYCHLLAAMLAVVFLPGCFPNVTVPDDFDPTTVQQEKIAPKDAKAMMGDVGRVWWYGDGVGRTAAAAGSVVLFPPMIAIYAGSSLMSLAGYDLPSVTEVIPGEQGKVVEDSFQALVSAPGRLNSQLAGEQYVSPERASALLAPHMVRFRRKVTTEEYLSAVSETPLAPVEP